MDFPSGVIDCGLIEYRPGLLRKRAGGIWGGVAERVYVTCYGFATRAGVAYGHTQDITHLIGALSLLSAFSPLSRPQRRRRRDYDDDDDDGRPPAAIVIAAANCRSPEAAKHVPLILPPLDDDYLIHEPHLDRRSSPPPSPRRPRRARWPIARTSPHIPRCPSRLSPRPSAPLPSTAYRITATLCPLSTQGHVPARLLITSVASTRHPLRRSPLASLSSRGTSGRGRLQRHQLHLLIDRDSAFRVPSLLGFISLILSLSWLQAAVTYYGQGKVGAGSR